MDNVNSDEANIDKDKRRRRVDPERRTGPERHKSVDPEKHSSSNPECLAEHDFPDTPHRPFLLMEELLEKLKLVNYEKGFCQQLQFKPISRHYFAIPTNPGEQFYYFVSLAAWLLKSCDRKMDEPRECDDPNALIAVILESLRCLKFKPEFAPSKLKTGCGEQCIWVLDCLASYIIETKHLVYNKPCYYEEQSDYVEIIDDTCDELEEDLDHNVHCISDDIEEDDLGVDNLESLCRARSETKAGSDRMSEVNDSGSTGRGSGVSRPAFVMESNTDATAWNLEVERMLPLLKITTHSEKKDWRDHIQQIHNFSDAIETAMGDVRVQMSRLCDDVTRTMDKIDTRERYLNQQLQNSLADHRERQYVLSKIKHTYREASCGVGDKSSHLIEISERLEQVKQEMEERGTAMTDGVPLVKIKQAIVRTRQESSQMDVRIGLLQHMQLRQMVNSKLRMSNGDVSNSGC